MKLEDTEERISRLEEIGYGTMFKSANETKKSGFTPSCIWKCLKSENCQIYKGFKWEYLHKI